MAGQFGSKEAPIQLDHESPEHAGNWVSDLRKCDPDAPLRGPTATVAIGWRHPTIYDAVVEMAREPEVFSSQKTSGPASGGGSGGIAIPFTPIPRANGN